MCTKNYLTEDPEWVLFYPKFNFSLMIDKAGYFDERPELRTSITQLIAIPIVCLSFISCWFLFAFPFLFLGWGYLIIKLPIKTGIQECAPPRYGVTYHDDIIWFHHGNGFKTITMPWCYQWYRTSTLLKDGTWFHALRGKPLIWSVKDIYDETTLSNIKGTYKWLRKNQWEETHPYLDVQATISVDERELRMAGLRWTSFLSKTSKGINVEFSDEVGRERGTWKGGVLACSYDMKPTETPYECLKRMEKERTL